MLNPESPTPLYAQLAERLSEQIHSGAFAPGSRLPSEPELAATYRIGRPTVRQATDVLVARRLIMRRRGSGTFVLRPSPEVDVFSVSGTLASFQAKGLELDSEIVEPVRLVAVPEERDNPLSGKQAFRFSRVSWVRGETPSVQAASAQSACERASETSKAQPVLLERFLLDSEVFAGIERMPLSGRSLAQIVRDRFYLRPTGGRQSFQVGYLDGRLGRAMRVPERQPLLHIRRSLDFQQAFGALFSELFCRTEELSFAQEMGGQFNV